MQRDTDGSRVGERPDEVVGRRHRKHLPDEAGALRQRLRGSLHAAAARVTNKRGEVGRAGQPDAHAMVEAEGAQPCDEIEYRARIEAELGDDLHVESGRLRGRDFRRQRAIELLIADARMAAGITGDADAADAAAAQRAAVDGVNGALQ